MFLCPPAPAPKMLPFSKNFIVSFQKPWNSNCKFIMHITRITKGLFDQQSKKKIYYTLMIHPRCQLFESTFMQTIQVPSWVLKMPQSCEISVTKNLGWFQANKLALRLKRSKLTVFSSGLRLSPRINLCANFLNSSVSLDQVQNQSEHTICLLGFWFNEKLTINDHFLKVTS